MDAIQQSLNEMMETFHKRLDTIEGQLPSTPPTTSEGLAAELASFKAFVVTTFRAVQAQISILAQQVDQGEMRARRKILLLHGLPEEQKEETSKVVVNALAERLNLPDFSATDISRCHRMGRTAKGKPRPVLFKLHDVGLRDKVWLSKTGLKGSGITLSEFLTKTRHDVFLAARERFGVTKCWTMEGNIFICGPDGVRHRVNSIDDLTAVNTKTAPVAKTQAASSQGAAAVAEPKGIRPRRFPMKK